MGLSALVQVSLPGGTTRTRPDDGCLAVPPALALTLPSARLQAVLPACPLALQLCCLPSSLKQCCPLPRGSGSGSALRTYPDGALRFSPISDTASGRCSDGVSHTRRDVASPASVSILSIASIVEPVLGGGPTLALLRTLSQAKFTSPSPSWRLMEDRSCSLSFFTQHRCCLLHCSPLSVS